MGGKKKRDREEEKKRSGDKERGKRTRLTHRAGERGGGDKGYWGLRVWRDRESERE